MNFLPLAFLLFFSPAPDPDADFFLAQAGIDPELRIADAYKWLFHATRGGEHAIANEFAVRKWLDQEWATLGPPQPGEPLWVPLTPDGRIGRLNLRPYRARGGTPDALQAAFLASAKSFAADPARFRTAWNALGRQLVRHPQGYLTRAEWERLDRERRGQGYPAIHHSPEYENARQPAYRVLTTLEAGKLTNALPVP
jgi:hypothetical protein